MLYNPVLTSHSVDEKTGHSANPTVLLLGCPTDVHGKRRTTKIESTVASLLSRPKIRQSSDMSRAAIGWQPYTSAIRAGFRKVPHNVSRVMFWLLASVSTRFEPYGHDLQLSTIVRCQIQPKSGFTHMLP